MGRGSSKVGGGGGGGASKSITSMDSVSLIRKIDSTGFSNSGGGVWNLDISGIGGAQILDETGSTRALRAGFMPGQKAYSYTVWDENSNFLSSGTIVNSLNDAKNAAKSVLKNHAPVARIRALHS